MWSALSVQNKDKEGQDELKRLMQMRFKYRVDLPG